MFILGFMLFVGGIALWLVGMVLEFVGDMMISRARRREFDDFERLYYTTQPYRNDKF